MASRKSSRRRPSRRSSRRPGARGAAKRPVPWGLIAVGAAVAVGAGYVFWPRIASAMALPPPVNNTTMTSNTSNVSNTSNRSTPSRSSTPSTSGTGGKTAAQIAANQAYAANQYAQAQGAYNTINAQQPAQSDGGFFSNLFG